MPTIEIIIILATIALIVLLFVFIPVTSHYSSEKPQTISLTGPPVDALVDNYDSFISVEYHKGGNWTPTMKTMVFDTGSDALILPDFTLLDATKYTVIADNIYEPWGCPAKILKGPIRLGMTMEIPECQFVACTAPNSSGNRTGICGASIGLRDTDGPYPRSPIVQLCRQLKRPFCEIVINTSNLNSQVSFFSNKPSSYSQKNVGGPFPMIPNIPWTAIAIEGIKVDGNSTEWQVSSANEHIGLLDTGGGPVMINDDPQQSLVSAFKKTSNCPGWVSPSSGAKCFSDQITVNISPDFEVKYPDDGKTTTVLFSHPGTFTSWGEYVVSLNFGGPFFLYACNVLIDTKQLEVYLQPK